jgi:hypothetical protein
MIRVRLHSYSRTATLLVAVALLPITGPSVATAPAAPDQPDAVAHLLGAVMAPSPLGADLAALCDGIGGRPTGSPAMGRAVDWAVAAFTQAGVDRVVREAFEMPLRWEEGATSIGITRPEVFPLRAVAAAWSPATPPGGLEAPVLDAGRCSAAHQAAQGAAAPGAIQLVFQDEIRTHDYILAE